MTAINIANQIPNSIVTLEQAICWACLAGATINPSIASLETQNQSELVMQTAIFTGADKTQRLLLRASIELDPAFMYDRSKKLWMFAREISQTQLPAAFTTN